MVTRASIAVGVSRKWVQLFLEFWEKFFVNYPFKYRAITCFRSNNNTAVRGNPPPKKQCNSQLWIPQATLACVQSVRRSKMTCVWLGLVTSLLEQAHKNTDRTFQVKCVLELPPLVLFFAEHIEAWRWRAESETLDNTTLIYFSGKKSQLFNTINKSSVCQKIGQDCNNRL